MRSQLCMSILCVLVLSGVALSENREEKARDVVVSAESDEAEHNQFTEPGEYAQPAWAERSRFSSTTSVYVLSPWEMFAGNIWEADFNRHGKSVHELTQEIDLGLLHRFEIGFENDIGLTSGDAHETRATVELRYALADWNKLPLNPAISVDYIFGTGRSVKTSHDAPDAFAVRLLLGQDFKTNFGYGLNIGLQQDVSGDSGRKIDISQSVVYGAMKGKWEIGAEMRFAHNTPQVRAHERNELELGPSIGWKPTRQIRVSIAPLFGVTHESPVVANFLLVSYEFGGAEAIVPEAH